MPCHLPKLDDGLTPTPYHYLLYGLQIGSSAPITGLVDVRPSRIDDLLIVEGLMPTGLEPESPRWKANDRFIISPDAPPTMVDQELRVSDDERYLQWRYGSDIILVFALDGSRIWVRWSAAVDPSLRAFNLFGPALGMVLKLRGLTALHASVIDVGGKALAFIGESGAGKSTLAAAFEQEGYPILSDDLCVLLPQGHDFIVPTGPPRIRLMPDAASALYGRLEYFRAAPDVESGKVEHALRWVTTGAAEAAPLAAIYYLAGRANEASFSPITGRDALFLLMKHVYLRYVYDAASQNTVFRDVGKLLRGISINNLVVTEGHHRLKKLCRELVSRHS